MAAEPTVSTGAGRRLALVVGLFLLAPFVGEFAMGNLPITSLPYLLALAPMYGGGAVLIRELARRTPGGWPMIIGLAAGYALVEEGLVDQMLMNPNYLVPGAFGAVIPGVAISAELTAASLAVHAVWSICVPIAIIEAFDRSEAKPWLGRTGLVVIGVVFVLGSLAMAFTQWDEHRFLATPVQFAAVGAVIVALAAAALTVPRRWSPAPRAAVAPRPRTVAWSALGLSTLYWISAYVVPMVAGSWAQVLCWAALAAISLTLLARCSMRPGWGRAHRLGVAVGTLCTYLWVSFVQSLSLGLPLTFAILSCAAVGTGTAAIMALAVRAERRHRRSQPTETASLLG